MDREGPLLEKLLRRIIDTPPDFLAEPKVGNHGVVHVDAVAGDVASLLGGVHARKPLSRFATDDMSEQNRLAIALLACWVYADAWFRAAGIPPHTLIAALDALSSELSPHAPAKSFHADPDRREELVRTALARLNMRPAGETAAQAQDRLTNVSAAERRRTVDAARGAAERVRAIREALARKAAEESADKMWRE